MDILSYVHVRRLTPAPGLIFHVGLSNHYVSNIMVIISNDF